MTEGLLAKKLRVLRAERGYSLTTASEKIGIDRHTLRQLELGVRGPYYGTLRKIATGYGVEIEDLVETPDRESQQTSKGQAPPVQLTELHTERRAPVVGEPLEELRRNAEAFVERWDGTASTIESLPSEGVDVHALLGTVEWAVTVETNMLLREFARVPPSAITRSRSIDQTPIGELRRKVIMITNGLRRALMADASTRGELFNPSARHRRDEQEYEKLLALAAIDERYDEPGPGENLGGADAGDTLGFTDREQAHSHKP